MIQLDHFDTSPLSTAGGLILDTSCETLRSAFTPICSGLIYSYRQYQRHVLLCRPRFRVPCPPVENTPLTALTTSLFRTLSLREQRRIRLRMGLKSRKISPKVPYTKGDLQYSGWRTISTNFGRRDRGGGELMGHENGWPHGSIRATQRRCHTGHSLQSCLLCPENRRLKMDFKWEVAFHPKETKLLFTGSVDEMVYVLDPTLGKKYISKHIFTSSFLWFCQICAYLGCHLVLSCRSE